jgi:ubiquinone/menaquinone biosynthesis C-methylase UbiE
MIAYLKGWREMAHSHKTDDIQVFDRRSSSYEHALTQQLFFDRIHRHALALVPDGANLASILDIGCGTGRLLRKAARKWPQAGLTGVDPAKGMIEQAEKLTPGATFHLGQAESLPLEEAAFDLVLSTMSFHHWQDQAQGFRQVARVLRPGGYFVLVDLLTPLGWYKVFPHGKQASPGAIRQFAAQAGLQIAAQRRSFSFFVLENLCLGG